MGRLLRDFHCDSCNTSVERFVDSTVLAVPCECGYISSRVIGMPRVALDGTDPGFPGAYEKWANVREQNARIKARRSYHGE